MQNIDTILTLDVYDYDLTPSTIKAIALDSNTRSVTAYITHKGQPYDIGQANVTLTVIRPDGVGAQVTGEAFEYEASVEDTTVTRHGASAELSPATLAMKGTLLAQFMFTSGEQVLRTEIFMISCGEALDASTDTWAGEYQGYNLDELVQNVNSAVATVEGMEQDVSELKSGFNDFKEEVDNTINVTPGTPGTKNLVGDKSENLTLSFETGYFGASTTLFGFYVPVDSTKGTTITIEKASATSRFRAVACAEIPTVGATYDNSRYVKDDSAAKIEYVINSSDGYLYVAYYSSTYDAGTAKEEILSGMKIYYGTEYIEPIPPVTKFDEIYEEMDEIRSNSANLDGKITEIHNDLYITNSAQNLFDERSATKTLALSEGTFTSATTLYGFYVPIDTSKGTITVRRKNIGTRFRIVSSIQEPAVGVNYFNREDHDAENGFTYTPLFTARYIYIAYYSSTQDTLTEAELLEDFAIYYGTGIQTEEISKIDLLAHAKDIAFKNGTIDASGNVVDSATNIISDKYRASGYYVVSCPSAYVVTVHVLNADGSVTASYETTNGVKRYNLTGVVRVTVKKADESAITPSSVDFSQIKISGVHFSPLAYTDKMTFILDAENSKTSDVYAYIDSHMKTHGMYASKAFLCNDSSGLPIYYYTLGDGAKTIFLVSGQHGPAIVSGDPRDSVISVAKIMCDLMDGNFAVGSFLEKLHDEYTIVIIPVFNPYGFDNFSRTNGDGVDTNRDWTNGNVVQVAAAKQLINGVNPFMLLDIHCNGSNPVDLPNLEIQYNFGTYNDQFGDSVRRHFASYYNTAVYGRPNTVDANMLGPYARVTLGILGGLLELRWWLKEDEILHNSQVESANYAMIVNAIKFFTAIDASEAYSVERIPNQNQY